MGFIASANSAAKGSGKTDIPNYGDAATATMKSSRPNWSGPTGGQQWQYDPTTGQSSMQVTSPYQGTFDALGGSLQRSASYDPTQARDAAVKQNMDYGMSMLQPILDKQQGQFTSGMANQGLDPGTEAYGNANTALSNQQGAAMGSVVNSAIQAGNETQRTGILQQMVPFQQLGSLTNSTYASPYMGKPADYLGAAEADYNARRNNAAVDQQNMQNAANSWGQTAGKMGGK
jgi:hypothetical protein